MDTTIIFGANQTQRLAYIDGLLRQMEIDRFDRITLQKEDTTIGIGDIHAFIGNISMMPQFSTFTAAIIHNAHHLTPEAQNALLKTLEEPPPHLRIILEATSGDQLLPTILSRTKIIRLKVEQQTEPELAEDVLMMVSGTTPAESLKNAEILLKKYPQPLHFLNNATMVLHRALLSTHVHGKSPDPLSQNASFLLKRMMVCRQFLKASVTPIAVMDYLVGLK